MFRDKKMETPQNTNTDRTNETIEVNQGGTIEVNSLVNQGETVNVSAVQEAQTNENNGSDYVVPEEESAQEQRIKFEVVFFVRYNRGYQRPSVEDIKSYFSNYGTVHHINCPENKNFAFVFMESLLTEVKFRRTRTTISQIIREMDPECKFFITVANSNRNRNDDPQPVQNHPMPYPRERQMYQKSGQQRRNFGNPQHSFSTEFVKEQHYSGQKFNRNTTHVPFNNQTNTHRPQHYTQTRYDQHGYGGNQLGTNYRQENNNFRMSGRGSDPSVRFNNRNGMNPNGRNPPRQSDQNMRSVYPRGKPTSVHRS